MAIVINPASFVLGQNSAMWLDKATATEMKVMGLQGMGLGLGFTQSSTTVQSMGVRIAPKVYTGAEYDEMSVNANFIPGDKSQEALQEAALAGNILKNIRMYLKDGCNFSAPDQPSAGGGYTSGTSGMNVGNYSDPQIGSPSDIYTNSVSFAPAGPFALFVAHTLPGDGANVIVESEVTSGAGATITLTDLTAWAALGFEVGDTIIVDWNGTSPKYAVVDALNTNVLTCVIGTGDAATLADGALDAAGQVHGATPMAVASMNLDC